MAGAPPLTIVIVIAAIERETPLMILMGTTVLREGEAAATDAVAIPTIDATTIAGDLATKSRVRNNPKSESGHPPLTSRARPLSSTLDRECSMNPPAIFSMIPRPSCTIPIRNKVIFGIMMR